jgi:hypothetical protein
MIDMQKLFEPTFNVKIRLTANQTFNYYIDIDDILNDEYPFSNDKRELMFQDGRRFSYLTDAYADWSRKGPLQEQLAENNLAYQQQHDNEMAGFNAVQSIGSSVIAGGSFGSVMAGFSMASSVFGGLMGIWGRALQHQYQRQQMTRKIEQERMQVSMTPARQHSGSYFGDLITGRGDTRNDVLTDRSIIKRYTLHKELKNVIWSIIQSRGFKFTTFEEYTKYINRKQFNFATMDMSNKVQEVYNELLTLQDVYTPLKTQQSALFFIHSIGLDN